MVIRLDAKPVSAAATPSAVPQQKYPPPTVQVHESRDRLPLSDVADGNASPVVIEITHSASTETNLSAAGESSSSSLQSTLQSQNDNEFVRAINIEGSKGLKRQKPAGTSALTSTPTPTVLSVTRHRFVKKTAGMRDVELRQASPSSSPLSGSSSKESSRDSVQPAGIDQVKEDLPRAAVTAVTSPSPGYGAASTAADVQLPSASASAGRSVANRIAVFDQQPKPTLSDSGLSLSSVDVTPTSAGTGKKMQPSSRDSLPVATDSVPGKGPKRRAPVGPGKFKLNTAVSDVAPTPTVSPVPGGQREQEERMPRGSGGQSEQEERVPAVKDEDEVVDCTRL